MNVIIEPHRRYDQSFRYQLHDAYYAARGIRAWTENEIPHEITTNVGTARQHVRLLLAHFLSVEGQLAPDEPYTVLEIGGGLGRFVRNVFHALDALPTYAGRQPTESLEDLARFSRRLRYVFSDMSARSLAEAAGSPDLEPLVSAGRVVPALFDVRTPEQLVFLDGAPVLAPGERLSAVIANYVVCTTPVRIVQRRSSLPSPDGAAKRGRSKKATWFEAWVETAVEAHDDSVIGDGVAQEILGDPTRKDLMPDLLASIELRPIGKSGTADGFSALHEALLERLLSHWGTATVAYPTSFVDAVLALGSTMVPGGLFAVSDLGRGEEKELSGEQLPAPQHYGNTLNHVINFGIFDALAAETSSGAIRTRGYLPSIFQAAWTHGRPLPARVKDTFQAHFIDSHEGHELLDLTEAANDASRNQAFHRSTRLFEKALALDPLSPRLHYLLGESCVHSGHYELARDILRRGYDLDERKRFDFDFLLGRVYASLREHDAALEWLHLSLSRELHPMTLTNIAEVHRLQNDFEGAIRYYTRALVIDPEYEHAKNRLDDLKETWWKERIAGIA